MVLKCLVVGGLSVVVVVGNGVVVVFVLVCPVVVVVVVLGCHVVVVVMGCSVVTVMFVVKGCSVVTVLVVVRGFFVFILFSGVGSCSLFFLLGVTFTTIRGRSPVIVERELRSALLDTGGKFWPSHSGMRVSRAPQPIVLALQEIQRPLQPSSPPGFHLLLPPVSGPLLPSLPPLPEYPSGLRPYTSEGVSCGCVPSGHHSALTPLKLQNGH